MSKRFLLLLMSSLALAGCGGNPIGDGGGGGGGGGGTTNPLVPAAVSMNVEAAALQGWSSNVATIAVQMTAQDATDLSGNYGRNAALDVGDYEAYSYQTTTSNRMVVALVRKVDGVAAISAVDAGQFANYHGGAQVWRADVFTRPSGGGVGARYDYSGTYAGLLNTGTPTGGGPGGTLNPTQSWRTTGRALITADFTEMRVSGGVDQRTVLETGGSLADIALWATAINADGTFTDSVRRADPSGWTSAGTYGGAFNGDADAVAAVMVFNPVSGAANLYEHGMIVLPSCTAGGGPACP